MKIEILKENFKNGLNIIEKIIGKNLSLPILDNVLIDTDENYLTLTSTDLETAIKLWILTKIVKKGKIVVPAKFLSSFVSSLPNDKILIEEKKNGLYIECKNLKTQIQGYNPDDFPIIPEVKNIEFLELDNLKICEGISSVVDIASNSQSRPEISGIYFIVFKNTIKIVATDSFRLAEKTILLEKPVKKDYSFIIPQKPTKEIMNILSNKNGLLKLYFSPNQVLFEFPENNSDKPQIQITSRLIEGEYPNYQDIIPSKFQTKIILKRDEFLNNIKIASMFSGKINEVKLLIDKNKKEIEVFSQSPEIGENKSTMPIKIEGESIEVSFNYKFLIDGLNNIKSSEVLFELSEKDGPCVLKPIGDISYLYVVMPIKSN